MFTRCRAFLICVWMLAPVASFGQTEGTPLPPPPPPRPVGQMRFDHLTMTPVVSLAHVGIDNNVLNSRGEPQSDFTATVSPQLKTLYNRRRADLDVTLAAPFIFYKTYTDLGGFAPRLSIQGEYRFNPRVAVFSSGELASLKDRPSVEIDTRSRRRMLDVSAGIRLGLSRKAAFELAGRQQKTTYDAGVFFRGIELRQTLNEARTGASVAVDYKATPYTTIRPFVAIDDVRFPLSGERNGQSRDVAVALKFNPRALVTGEAQVGYRVFRSRSAIQPDFSGPAVDARLTYVLTPTTGVRVGGDQDLVPSFDVVHPYFLAIRYDGAVQQRLGRRFDIGVDYNAVAMRYRTLLTSVKPAQVDSRDAVTTYGMSFGLLTRHWGRYAVYVSRWSRSSEFDPSRNYANTRVGFMISATRWLTSGESTHGFFVDTAGF